MKHLLDPLVKPVGATAKIVMLLFLPPKQIDLVVPELSFPFHRRTW